MRCDLEDAPGGPIFQSDICVVGGGIAGLILARKLGRAGKTVHLLEAGGATLEPRSQDLYTTVMAGALHRGTTEGRFRTFGGSSTRWAAQLLPYPDEVFAPRPAVAHLGWPISGADIERYYGEVHEIMQANALPFDASFLERVGGAALPASEAVRVRFSKWAPFSRRNLGNTVGRDCLASDKVTVFLHANALALRFSPGGGVVAAVEAVNYRGQTFTFQAREFVLSSGTLEVSRLLLHSIRRSPAPEAFHDQVGRYFFDHLTCSVGQVAPDDLPVFYRHFAPYYRKRNLHTPRFETSAAFQQQTGMLAVMGHFEVLEVEGSGYMAFRRILHNLQTGTRDREQKLSALPSALWGGLRTAYHLKVRGRRIPAEAAEIALRFDVEQKPQAESRIMLSDQLDALGLPRILLDWRRSSDESRAMFAFAPQMDAFLKAAGMQLRWWPGLLKDTAAWDTLGHDVFHPMGGARMGLSPRTSVVDAQLRVHGVANLSVASCAVYPSGGSSNPTFTLMALALRLADRLAAV